MGLQFFFLVLMSIRSSWALSSASQELVRNETQANMMALRSSETIDIENFEIPLDLLETDVASRIPPELRNALIFERNGKQYVRWMINPEDPMHYKAVEEFLRSNRVSTARRHYFKGYMTASRSYILEDPNTHVEFSGKVSTVHPAGLWANKKQVVPDGRQARIISDYIEDMRAHYSDSNSKLLFLDEPAMFGINHGIDQAFLVRSLDPITAGKFHYIPGFSVLL